MYAYGYVPSIPCINGEASYNDQRWSPGMRWDEYWDAGHTSCYMLYTHTVRCFYARRIGRIFVIDVRLYPYRGIGGGVGSSYLT